jgi:2-polyprenyl-6-methoxyphenol hydroxylase-like FAD-dependent oxidoreductase
MLCKFNVLHVLHLSGWWNVSGEQIKEEALQQVSKSFPSTPLSLVIGNTPPEGFTKATIRHRLNTNPESLVNGCVTVAGDAAHPTTPNMGQGGCMALEDALILTQKLYGMLRSTPNTEDHETPEHERIHQALVEFQRERHERTNFITTRSYRIGRMMQTGWTVVDFVRDRFVIPLVLNKNTFVAHTLFDVGKLPTQSP